MTSARPDTWMPLYIGDYLADTMHLDAEQHGAYFLLIMHYWRNGGAIKNDKNLIKNVSKISPKKCEEILQEFFILEGGFWHHKRINEELSEATKHQENRRSQTEAATRARIAKQAQKKQETTNVTNNVATDVTLTPLPLPSPLPKGNNLSSSVITGSAAPPVEVIVIFDECLTEVFGSPRQFPAATDFTYAQRFLEAGATPDWLRTLFRERMGRLKAQGKQAPTVLKYFDQIVQDGLTALATGGQKMPVATPEKPKPLTPAERAKNIAKNVKYGLRNTSDEAWLEQYESEHGRIEA